MTNISLNSGGTVLIGSVVDALEVIDSKLSYELASYLRNIIEEAEAETCEQVDEAEFWIKQFDECRHKVAELETENARLRNEIQKLKKRETKAEIPDEDLLPF